MDENILNCPFCATQITQQATVCPSCHAVKGYRLRTGMKLRFQVVAYAVFLLAVSLLCFVIGVTVMNGSGAFKWVLVIGAIVLGMCGTWLVIYAKSGPKWYRATS